MDLYEKSLDPCHNGFCCVKRNVLLFNFNLHEISKMYLLCWILMSHGDKKKLMLMNNCLSPCRNGFCCLINKYDNGYHELELDK